MIVMENSQKIKIFLSGFISASLLLILYFLIVTGVSGFKFALSQFTEFWYFLISLALGFGAQISLYAYLKFLIQNKQMKISGKTIAVTGTTSTLAMISCCAHYLVNIAPVLGIAGVLSAISQYQIQLFRVGLAFNLGGIIFIASKILKFKKAYASA